mmetsp:Transcript_7254/g.9854  ORF Transcript_7254/g.9854 Transcript_7254/m.9854 type:complete len:201 (-) Transcript_7254:389-991(-)
MSTMIIPATVEPMTSSKIPNVLPTSIGTNRVKSSSDPKKATMGNVRDRSDRHDLDVVISSSISISSGSILSTDNFGVGSSEYDLLAPSEDARSPSAFPTSDSSSSKLSTSTSISLSLSSMLLDNNGSISISSSTFFVFSIIDASPPSSFTSPCSPFSSSSSIDSPGISPCTLPYPPLSLLIPISSSSFSSSPPSPNISSW